MATNLKSEEYIDVYFLIVSRETFFTKLIF